MFICIFYGWFNNCIPNFHDKTLSDFCLFHQMFLFHRNKQFSFLQVSWFCWQKENMNHHQTSLKSCRVEPGSHSSDLFLYSRLTLFDCLLKLQLLCIFFYIKFFILSLLILGGKFSFIDKKLLGVNIAG